MPDVKDLSETAAQVKLREAGFTRTPEFVRPSLAGKIYIRSTGCSWRSDGLPSKYRDGHVCHQRPYPNTRQSSGVPLTLELAERTSMKAMPMPNVLGMPFEQAKRLLERHGFKKIVRRPSKDKTCKPGIVCSQNIKPRQRAVFALTKYLFVGKPETHGKIPN